MQLGNLDKWPAFHVFGTVQNQTVRAGADHRRSRSARRAPPGPPRRTQAAADSDAVGATGYFNEGVNGTDDDAGVAGVRHAARRRSSSAAPGYAADLEAAMGDERAASCRPRRPRGRRSRARPAAPACRSRSPAQATHPDAAAAYIDFITNADAMGVLTETGNLPVVRHRRAEPRRQVSQDDLRGVAARWPRTARCCRTSTTPPRPWATRSARPAGPASPERATPEEFLATVEADYSSLRTMRRDVNG